MNSDCKVIAYMRLSSEDKTVRSQQKNESDSIANQRLLIREYISKQPTLVNCEVVEMIDDGYSGTNFERPAITEALEMLKTKKAHCIVVKDISRFGRNYIDVGNYLEQIFPFYGIRFIAVNDDYDSDDPNCVGSLISVFKALFADLYSKDLSQKVKSAKLNLAKKGVYLNPFAPYGYIKSPTDSKKLAIDENAAEVVKWIFHSFLNAKSLAQIARELNIGEVLTPMLYKKENGCTRNWDNCAASETNFWTDDSVTKILRDERYVGTVVYGKLRKVAVGSTKVACNPREEWICVPKMHDGIVTDEVFAKAQELFKKMTNRNFVKQKSLLFQKVKCAYCGKTLKLLKTKTPYFYCDTRRFTDKFDCTTTKLLLDDLKKAVISSIRMQAICAVEAEKIINLKKLATRESLNAKEQEIKRIGEALTVCKHKKIRLFERKIDKKITDKDYIDKNKKYTEQEEILLGKLKTLQVELQILKTTPYEQNLIDELKSYQFIDDLTDEVIASLIDKIYVFNDGSIEIHWNVAEELTCIKNLLT